MFNVVDIIYWNSNLIKVSAFGILFFSLDFEKELIVISMIPYKADGQVLAYFQIRKGSSTNFLCRKVNMKTVFNHQFVLELDHHVC